MGFSAEWLALREPVDHASVNPEVKAALQARFVGAGSVTVVDLGCGAGSNLRGTWSALPDQQAWTLVDYDPKLLAAARMRLSAWADSAKSEGDRLVLAKGGKRLSVTFREADLSAGDDAAILSGADLVTAAALFDLVSVARIDQLAEGIAARQQAFYTVLTYDGHARWQPAHPLDVVVRDAFNQHQRSDKGFGPAAGPGGTTALAKAFYGKGYRVLRGTSPWVVGDSHAVMRTELDQGFAAAAQETGRLSAEDARTWLATRNAGANRHSIIGHEDLLALPG